MPEVAALAVFRTAPGERSGLLAAWYAAFLAGEATAVDAAEHVGRHDEVTVAGAEPSALPELLTRLPDIHTVGEPVLGTGNFFHTVTSQTARFTPEAAA